MYLIRDRNFELVRFERNYGQKFNDIITCKKMWIVIKKMQLTKSNKEWALQLVDCFNGYIN